MTARFRLFRAAARLRGSLRDCIAVALLGALLVAAPALTPGAPLDRAEARDIIRDNAPDEGATDGPGEMRLVAMSSPDSLFAPQVIALVGSDEEILVGTLPRWAPAERADRIDLTGIPYLGRLFAPRAATHEIEDDQRIGGLYRRGVALVAQIDQGRPSDWSDKPITLVTRTTMARKVVSITLTPTFAPPRVTRSLAEDPAFAARDAGQPIGGVYASDRGLVLAPPHAWLAGFDLQ